MAQWLRRYEEYTGRCIRRAGSHVLAA
jgi:hypothetical protein